MRGTVRIPSAAYGLVDGAARVLAVLALLHAVAAAVLPSYDPRWLGTPDGPIGWRLLLVLAVLFATAMLVVRPRIGGGVVVARAAATLLATACLVDALARFRVGSTARAPGPAVPLTLLLALFLYLWVLARRAPAVLRASGSQDRLWHKMLERAHP